MLKYLDFISENTKLSTSKYFIPSYEECKEICNANENFIFYESKHNVEGYNISIFNYRLAQGSNFESPIPGKNIKAHEMRGLTFVWNKDGTLYNRYLLLDKFFNLDQTSCSMYSVIKEFKIKNIFNKEDGSIASFVKIPNGQVLGRSKASFESDQAIEIQKIYNTDPNIKNFVDFCLDNEIVAIFEYVSPNNRIVVPYANTNLILLRMRDNNTGEYLDIEKYSDHMKGITIAESISGHTLDSIKEVVPKMIGKEGVIVQFENGKMIKIKSQWYMERHRLFTQEINRENTLIGMIIDETIDDVISQINEDQKKSEIEEVINIVHKEMSRISSEVDKLSSNYNGDKKDFAIKFNKHIMFPISIGVINGKDKIELIKRRIKSETKNLYAAKEWLEKAKNR